MFQFNLTLVPSNSVAWALSLFLQNKSGRDTTLHRTVLFKAMVDI
jgi:hypothetical protein